MRSIFGCWVNRQPKAAGVYLLGTAGAINPKSTEFMESACAMDENKVIHPFAFRTHTHSLGICQMLKVDWKSTLLPVFDSQISF